MYLTQFKKNLEGDTYHLKFSDGFEGNVNTHKLRDNCPCAGCKGEEVLMLKYVPISKPNVSEAGYQLEKIDQVGNYALQLFWKDGHNTGIYTWEYLKKIVAKS